MEIHIKPTIVLQQGVKYIVSSYRARILPVKLIHSTWFNPVNHNNWLALIFTTAPSALSLPMIKFDCLAFLDVSVTYHLKSSP